MKSTHITAICLLLTLSAVCRAQLSDFAVEVIEVQGDFTGTGLYDDPYAVLGKPALRCRTGTLPEPTYRVKLVQPAFNLSDTGQTVVTTINPGEYIMVKFDHRVCDFPGNPFGQDLIVFGNSYFFIDGTSYVDDDENINQLLLTNPAAVYKEKVRISVSQGFGGDPNDTSSWDWYTFDNGPWGDDLFPTQAYEWDAEQAQWTDNQMDFTKPVAPSLTEDAFSGLTVANAIELYDGSGGGTPFDLKDLPDYDELVVDPNTGYRWIQYVRFEGLPDRYGEIDAVADVAVCGDPTHPIPAGDITLDCRVDLWDLSILAGNWLECTYRCEQE